MSLIDYVQVPYLMRPGLSKLDPTEQLLHPETFDGRYEKRQYYGDPILPHAEGTLDIQLVISKLYELAPWLPPELTIPELMLGLQEDFAVMNSEGVMELICFSTPSGWAPEKYIGKSFHHIHQQIPDADNIRKAADHFVKLMTSGQSWRRYVWSLVAAPERCRHPDVVHNRTWDTTDTVYFRWEVQTIVPLEPGRMLFLVNHQVKPLVEACESYADAVKVYAALHSMTPAIREYKNLAHPRVEELTHAVMDEWFKR